MSATVDERNANGTPLGAGFGSHIRNIQSDIIIILNLFFILLLLLSYVVIIMDDFSKRGG